MRVFKEQTVECAELKIQIENIQNQLEKTVQTSKVEIMRLTEALEDSKNLQDVVADKESQLLSVKY
jgi:hypothetical protein